MPIKLDHIGLNTIIQEPVTASTNTIGYNKDEGIGDDIQLSTTYVNSEVVSINTSSYLAALNTHRNGPYNWPIFRQTRIGQNPLTRYQIKNSIFTYVTEIGEVNILTRDGKFLDSTRARRSELRSFIETPVVSGFKPLLLIGSTENESDNETDADERIQVEVSYANETTYFTNDLANKEHGLDEELDEHYEDFVDLYLDGGLDSDDSPFDEFELLQFSQTVYPKSQNSYSQNIRNRPTFESGYWKDSIADRTKTAPINNGFGFTIPAQSIWPLDVESDWKTRTLSATTGYFTASTGINWKWEPANIMTASGFKFISGSLQVISAFSQSVLAGNNSSFVLTNSVYQLAAEKGSLNSVKGNQRFWNSIESAMIDIGLRFPEGQTTFQITASTPSVGTAYQVPSLDDSEYELKLNATGSTNQARFRQIFGSSMTVSWREIGAFDVDETGASISGEGTYLYISDTNGKTHVKLEKNSGQEFQVGVSNNYDRYHYNGYDGTQIFDADGDGGTKVIFNIDKEQRQWRGWSSISLEIPQSEPPALFVNGISQSARVENNYDAYGLGVKSGISIDSGPNYTYGSNFTTGSFGWKINPNTTHNSIFAVTSSLIHTSDNHEKFTNILTLKLGDKPLNSEGEGYSIYTISGSKHTERLSLVHYATSSELYHSSLALILQQSDTPVISPLNDTHFDKIIWNIPLERSNKATKFYLYSDFDDKSKSQGWFHNDSGVSASMNVVTEGLMNGTVSASFNALTFITKDIKTLSSPTFLDTDVTICDCAILSGSSPSLTDHKTIGKFMHSGSVLNYTSSYMSSHSGLVYRWWDFAGATSSPRVGLTSGSGTWNIGDNNPNVLSVADYQTVAIGNRLTLNSTNKPGALSLDTGLSTQFLRYKEFTAEDASGAGIWVLTDRSGFSNLISTGDNRITEFSLIGHVDRGATKFYAQSGSNLYGYLGMTSSAISSVYPYSTASVIYRFETSSRSTIDNDTFAMIPNLGSGGSGSLDNIQDTNFGIFTSFEGAIQPIEQATGQTDAEGMLITGKQGFEYRVTNITQESLRENNNSEKVLSQFTGSTFNPKQSDLFVGGTNSFGNQKGGGVLVNSYNTFNRNEYTSSFSIDQQFSASCLYTRRHSLITASSFYNPFGMSFSASGDSSAFNRAALNEFELYQGMAFWDAPVQSGRKPFFNSYSEFAEAPKLVGKDYSIIPEFRISDHIDKYLVSGETSFNEGDAALFKIEGGQDGIADSNDDNFYETYSTTELLKNFDIIQGDNDGFVDPFSITLRCKAIKKLLPYKGFYPADRTVEIAQQFYSSYGENLLLSSDTTGSNNYVVQNLLTPLFSPGILFNTIKAGVACDYPLVTTKLKTSALSSSFANSPGYRFINQQFDTRIAFEALVEPEKYLANVELISNEPDTKALTTGDSVLWNGQGDEKYRLMASNFLAEVGEFYLQNKNYSTITSLPQGDPNFGNAKKDLTYTMRLRMYRSISGQKDMYGNANTRNALVWDTKAGLAEAGLFSDTLSNYLDQSNSYTISFWVKPRHHTGNERYVYIMRTDGYQIANAALLGDDNNDFFVMAGRTFSNRRFFKWENMVPHDEWSHITIIHTHMDDMTQPPVVYLNGVNVGTHDELTGSGTGALGEVSGDFTIGDYAKQGTAYDLGGALQDFAVWAGELNVNDALSLYNQGNWLDLSTHPKASMLQDWWLLGEEETIPEISGSNLEGVDGIISRGKYRTKLRTLANTGTDVSVTTGVGPFGVEGINLAKYSVPTPEGTFAVPQDTGSMSESITMYSRPSGFGPPQRLILSGSSKYKLKFNSWENFKKDSVINNYYHTSDAVFIENNSSSVDGTYKDLEYSNSGSAYVKGNDATQGYNYPFTPPYYHGEAWADITFKPSESKKYTLSEIMNSSSVEFLRYYEPYITSSAGETTSWRLVNEDAMQLASSVNIFSRGILPGTNTTDLDIANSYRWIVQSKFETPVLDFSDMALQEDQTGVDADKSISIPNIAPETTPVGMWHQYGNIPQQPDKGIFLQISDIPRRWTENAINGNFNATSSLADLCGFSTEPVRMGEIGSIKQVSEAIVAVPYIEEEGNRQFLKISKRDIEHALDPKLRHLVGQSLIDMTDRMKKFVLPPSMDFVKNKEIEPFAMYIFEFTHSFTREDLSNMWQNLQPDIGISHEVDEVEISHELLFHELLGGKAKIKPAPGSDNDKGAVLDRQARLSEINSGLRWMVFKAKQRAKNNYFDKIFARNESNFNEKDENNTNVSTAKRLGVGFNWPYDFFSLVELGKMEADIVFANVDDENQEEKTVIKPRTKASKVLPKRKESDEVINNSLFGTGENEPDEVVPTSEKAKVKPNPLGKLSRRRRKR